MGNLSCCKSSNSNETEINFKKILGNTPEQKVETDSFCHRGNQNSSINNNINIEISNKSKLEDLSPKKSEILELTVINSPLASAAGTVLRINEKGLIEGSLRNKNDGVTYFGFLSNLNNIDEEDSLDYLLPRKANAKENDFNSNYTSNDDNKIEGRFFQIKYSKENNSGYFLKDLGKGLGTFIKIKDSLLLRDSTLISIGDSFIVVNFENEENNSSNDEKLTSESKFLGVGKKIILRVYEGKNATNTQDYYFPPNRGQVIRIGRKKHGNDIELDDNLVSKINSNIQYNDYEGWVIRDGNEIRNPNGGIQKVASTNGTWFLPVEDFKIYDGMIFKGNFILFCCNLTPNDKPNDVS